MQIGGFKGVLSSCLRPCCFEVSSPPQYLIIASLLLQYCYNLKGPPLPFPHPTTHTNTTHTTTMASTYPALELQAVVGFGGKVPNGLLCHPDGVHLIYPLGSTIVVKNTVLGTQTFLQGHSNMVSCMELSRDGCKLASGQVSTSYCSSCQTTTTKKSIVQNT